MTEHRIPADQWRTIVEHAPIVSVDLVVEHDGGVLLGRRQNEPAKGEWFLPGGRVLKNEARKRAVHRVAEEELGASVEIRDCLGTAEHFYESADVPGVDSKHYLSTGYRCTFTDADPALGGDDQHSDFRVFEPPYPDLHEYVAAYVERL